MACRDGWERTPPAGLEGWRDGLGGWPGLCSTVWNLAPAARVPGGHPAPFPVELARRCIRLSTWPGEVVLDPFAGTGTTLLAARQLGRRAIGIEAQRGVLRPGRRPARPGGVRLPRRRLTPAAHAATTGVCTGAVLAWKPSRPGASNPSDGGVGMADSTTSIEDDVVTAGLIAIGAAAVAAAVGVWWALRHPRTTLAVAVPVAAYLALGPAGDRRARGGPRGGRGWRGGAGIGRASIGASWGRGGGRGSTPGAGGRP